MTNHDVSTTTNSAALAKGFGNKDHGCLLRKQLPVAPEAPASSRFVSSSCLTKTGNLSDVLQLYKSQTCRSGSRAVICFWALRPASASRDGPESALFCSDSKVSVSLASRAKLPHSSRAWCTSAWEITRSRHWDLPTFFGGQQQVQQLHENSGLLGISTVCGQLENATSASLGCIQSRLVPAW